MRNTRKSPAAPRLSLLVAVALLALVASAAFAQAPQPAAPAKAAVATHVTLNDIFAPAPTDAAARPTTPSQGAHQFMIQNGKANGATGATRPFSRGNGSATSDSCSGSCNCSTCGCYGTESCCSAGCSACFAVACDALSAT